MNGEIDGKNGGYPMKERPENQISHREIGLFITIFLG